MDTFMKNWSLSAHFIYQTIRRLFIWELIGSLLSVCGRQRPEQKKIYIFSRSAWPSKSSSSEEMQLFFAILCKNVNEVFNKNTDNIPHKIFDDECMHHVIWTSWMLKLALSIEWFLLILFFNCNQILNFGTPLVLQGITTLYLILGVH